MGMGMMVLAVEASALRTRYRQVLGRPPQRIR
jgi:hypothetical protein